ncbi:unknown protein [Desulfotalea psychrophila LSv54]|uniref:Uncharacterized protein n=1 Tax=Desulfotalea psychrophila (strain LSv54 / DSM 12343) TaxID=177439 RepID=Q6AQN7_DESPS|nr:unknown protein [Desulfotalea psychrophila LSv54]
MREKAVRWPDGLVFSTYYTIKTAKEEIRWGNHLEQVHFTSVALPYFNTSLPLLQHQYAHPRHLLTNRHTPLPPPPHQGGEAFCRINLAHCYSQNADLVLTWE